jgi:hypothetical protein
MNPDLATILSSPCCPGCLRTATRIEHSTDLIEHKPERPLPGASPVLHIWPDGTNYATDLDDDQDSVTGVGQWCIVCGCGEDIPGEEEDPIPTVRSLTPAAVLAWLDAR